MIGKKLYFLFSIDSIWKYPPSSDFLRKVFVRLVISIRDENFVSIKPKLYFLKFLKTVLSKSSDYLMYKNDIEEMVAKGVIPSLKANQLEYLVAMLYD